MSSNQPPRTTKKAIDKALEDGVITAAQAKEELRALESDES